MKKTYSTKEVARQTGIHWVTLLRWQAAGKISASEEIAMSGVKYWRWTTKDIAKVKKYKREHFREGQGRRNRKDRKGK